MTKKRVAIVILWTYSCWVAGGIAEFFIGTPVLLGVAVGIAGALFFGLDPFGVVWPKRGQETGSFGRLPSVEAGPSVGDARAR
jgi:hypothetical protein